MRGRGQPRKYSKTFLIFRCARIFEKFDMAGRRAVVNQINEATRVRKGKLAPAYTTGFVPFVQQVIEAIDPGATRSPHSLGKTVLAALKLRKAYPDADEFISNGHTAEHLVNFMKICEGEGVREKVPARISSTGGYGYGPRA
jgi:hypothetical protein